MGEEMTRPLAIIAPLADIVAVTAVALVPLMAFHISDAEAQAVARQTELQAKIVKQRTIILWHEKFLINCLSGRTLLVGREDAVDCVRL